MDFEKELAVIKAKATPLGAVKFVAGALVSCGAYAAVVGLLKGSMVDMKGLTKLMAKAGIFILGCKAGDVAEKYLTDVIDNTVNAFKDAQEETEDEPVAKQQ